MVAEAARRPGRDSRGSDALADLRARSLGYLLAFTAVGYFAWHTLFTAVSPFDDRARAWLLFPLVEGGVLACSWLRARGLRLAAPCFAVWGFACLAAATALFPAPAVLVFYPLLTLATAVTVRWPAAVATVLAEAALAFAAPALLPGAPAAEQFRLAVLAASLTVAVAWTLLRGLDVAVAWWLGSYDEARRNLEDAREHRGRLVQALAQLDDAFYRLRRANASLAEAWRAADRAERARAEFITNVSHELRTPLNLIAGFSELMLSSPEGYGGQPLPREYRGDLHAIYRSAQHLLALTDDVLDLAQAEMSHLALLREPTDLADVIRGAADIVRDYVETKGLRLDLHLAVDLPALPLDALRIRQVVMNLLTNAARFTDAGGIAVTLDRAGDCARVAVADTGKGLTVEQRERIFQEFQHLDPDAAREHRSTGLGLPISKTFVELHGGRMWVESAPGRGTTFRFELPISDQAASAQAGVAARPPSGWPTERVVILSRPDERLRRLLQRGLRGYRVLAAADREQAARLALDVRATAIIAVGADGGDLPGPTPRICCPLPTGGGVGALGGAPWLAKPVDRAALRAAIEGLPAPPRRVLVVDDDLHAVRLLGRMLKADRRGYEVLAAHNGDEALEAMRAQRPDLVLLDLMMPGLGGERVLETMADDPSLADLPVIVVSGHAHAEGALRVPGELRLSAPEGLELRELMGALAGLLAALLPPPAYLRTDPPGAGPDRDGSRA